MKHSNLILFSVLIFMLTSCTNIYDEYRELKFRDLQEVAKKIVNYPDYIDSILSKSKFVRIDEINEYEHQQIYRTARENQKYNYKYAYYDDKLSIVIYNNAYTEAFLHQYSEQITSLHYQLVFQRLDNENEYCTVAFTFNENEGWLLKYYTFGNLITYKPGL